MNSLSPTRLLPACAAMLFALAAHAQSGNITGQVFCSDTQKPARFATVSLTRTSLPALPAAPAIIKISAVAADRQLSLVQTARSLSKT